MESLDEMELASPHGPHDHGGHRTNLAHDYELLKRRHNLAQQGMLFFFGLMCVFLLVNYYGHTGHFEAATAGCDTPEDPHGHPHPTPGPSPTPTPTAPALMDLVGKEAILQRMQGLQDIAFNIGNGTRVVGTKGFQASVDYVLEQLQKPLANHGWQATRQHFGMNMPHLSSTPVLQELEPRHMPHAFKEEFKTLSYTGVGNVTAKVSVAANMGCDPADFWDNMTHGGSIQGHIALVLRGGCTFNVKAINALNSGAVAVVIYNHVGGNVFGGTLGEVVSSTLPVVGIPYWLGYSWTFSLPTLHVAVAGKRPTPSTQPMSLWMCLGVTRTTSSSWVHTWTVSPQALASTTTAQGP